MLLVLVMRLIECLALLSPLTVLIKSIVIVDRLLFLGAFRLD